MSWRCAKYRCEGEVATLLSAKPKLPLSHAHATQDDVTIGQGAEQHGLLGLEHALSKSAVLQYFVDVRLLGEAALSTRSCDVDDPLRS